MTADTPTPLSEGVWRAPDGDVWELDSAHGTGVVPVPLRGELEDAFAEGFRRSFAQLGMPLSHIELRHVNGRPYVSFFLHDVPRKAGPPPPALVLKILTRVHPGFRRRTRIARAALAERRPERWVEDWFDERQSWIDRIIDLQSADLAAMTDDELAGHLQQVADLAVQGFQRHFELVPGCIPLGRWLAQAETWGLRPDRVRAAVMHGTPVHDEARQRIERVADALGEAAPTDFDQIRSHSTEAAAALDDYLAHHGRWATRDELGSPQVRTFPRAVIGSIQAQRQTGGRAAAFTAPATGEIIEELRANVPPEDRDGFDRLVSDAHRAYQMLDDNSGILGSWLLGVTGEVLHAAAERLTDVGRLHDSDHVWALQLGDIVERLQGRSSLTADQAGAQHNAWRALDQLEPPPHLNGPPTPPPDPSVFPPPVSQLVTAITTFLSDKFNYSNEAIGIGTRTVRGRAVVAVDASDAISRIEPGDIIVTAATTPAYNTILPIVTGIVVSEGGPSCHAAVVARELDLPAIVGYANAPTSIPDGALIELDPTMATVTILSGP